MKPSKTKASKNVFQSVDQDVVEEDQQNDQMMGHAFRRSLLVLVAIACIVGGVYLIATLRKEAVVEHRTELVVPAFRETIAESELPEIPLVDITQAAGIHFEHTNGKAGERLLPETMGGGAGFIDFDNDGDQDLLCVNSCQWPWSEAPKIKPTMQFYENDGTGKFADISERVGLNVTFYGMGPAFGDFDGDGWTDIYITAVGKNRLYRNLEGKKFEEVAQQMGVAGRDDQWCCPAMWIDYDRDGKLDLLVGEYVKWTREQDLQQGFTLSGIGRAYGQPTAFGGTFLSLYHNIGKGFEEVSEKAGLQIRDPNTNVPVAKSLGMAMLDADCDGWMDIIVANDTVQNFLFINQKNGTFIETSYTAGVAVDRNGMSTGAMGIDVANYRNDDRTAIAIGNFANEPSSLYVSRGKKAHFSDEAASTGFGPQSRLRLTFGLFFADMDLDGRQDIVCANGHLEDEISKFQPSQHYEQAPQLFWNAGPEAGTELIDLNETKTGPDFHRPFVGRAACYADIDADGDLDILFIGNGQRAILFRNDEKLGHNWLRVKLKGKGANPEAIGAVVTIETEADTYQRIITPTRSYLSQCELPATFGLGNSKPTKLNIQWPDGSKQDVEIKNLKTAMVVEQSGS